MQPSLSPRVLTLRTGASVGERLDRGQIWVYAGLSRAVATVPGRVRLVTTAGRRRRTAARAYGHRSLLLLVHQAASDAAVPESLRNKPLLQVQVQVYWPRRSRARFIPSESPVLRNKQLIFSVHPVDLQFTTSFFFLFSNSGRGFCTIQHFPSFFFYRFENSTLAQIDINQIHTI